MEHEPALYGTIPERPDYLSSDLIDEDVKAVFKGKGGYFTHEILMLQLIKELKNRSTNIEPMEHELKVNIVSSKCVNSNWPARFLAKDGQEYCQCSFGECKVEVLIEHNGHSPRKYVLTEGELAEVTAPTHLT